MYVTIAQVRCESLQIDTRSQYLHEPVVIGRHKLRLDGEFREDTGWNGSTSKQLTATKLRDGILEIVTKPAKPDDSRGISWQVQYPEARRWRPVSGHEGRVRPPPPRRPHQGHVR